MLKDLLKIQTSTKNDEGNPKSRKERRIPIPIESKNMKAKKRKIPIPTE
ncbi:9847_t:CDS:1, partial [Scutellospora calospora]